MYEIVPAAIAASLSEKIKEAHSGMSVSQALDKLGLLDCDYYLAGRGIEENHGLDIRYSLPGERWATVSFRVDMTRALTNDVPHRGGRGGVWDSIENRLVKNCALRID